MRRTYRWCLGAGLLLMVSGALLLVACGGGDDDDDSGDSGSEATATPTSDDGGSQATATADDSGSGNGDGGSESELEQLADDLKPPNSKETSLFTAADALVITWESDDSVDSLKDYYDDRLDDLGLSVAGTMDLDESYSWVIEGGDGDFGGIVAVGPSDDGTSYVTVTIAVN